MASPKYPPFERVTAGSLRGGDRILVRDRLADRVWIEARRHGGRRASRLYQLHLLVAGRRDPVALEASHVLRFNRVVEP